VSAKVITTKVKTGFVPRQLQQFLYKNLTRFAIAVIHRRAGKTVFAVNLIIAKALKCKLKNPEYAYITPFYSQAKKAAWKYFKEYTAKIPGVKIYESDPVHLILPNGATISIAGGDNPDALRGSYYDGVVLDEYAQMRQKVWTEVIRPTLSDRQGWVLFIGTPMGKNAFFELYDQAKNGFVYEDGNRVIDPEWSAFMFKASETGIISEKELASARRDMKDTQGAFEQEYECNFNAAIIGAYYGTLINSLEEKGRLIDADIFEPKLPVHTAWDLGIGDSTAIWFFQIFGQEVRIINYYENNSVGLEHYVNILREKNYNYGDHWLPHDATVHELGTGRTRVETLRGFGLNPRLIPRLAIEDGINAVRKTLPFCYFSAKKCAEGLEALRQYRREWDDKRKDYNDRPYHDWTSHAADAFRYLSSAWRMQVEPKIPEKKPDGYTINDLIRVRNERKNSYRRI